MYEHSFTDQEIELTGKSGQRYQGRIYSNKEALPEQTGPAIALLSTSHQDENGWQHQVNSIYHTGNIRNEMSHFQTRDDISHLIIIPDSGQENGVTDKVDDLIRQYIHR